MTDRILVTTVPNLALLAAAVIAVNDQERLVPFGTAHGDIALQIVSLDRRSDDGVISWNFLADSPGPAVQYFKGFISLDTNECWLEPLP